MSDGVDVVIPSHGRDRCVGGLVRVLSQDVPDVRTVHVVDSSGGEVACDIAAQVVAGGGIYVTGPASAGAKRNIGARLGQADLIYFTDADCYPCPSSVARLVRTLACHPDAVAAAGPTRLDGGAGFLERCRRRSPGMGAAFQYPGWKTRLEWATCTNLLVRREAFLAVGGFDETLPLPVYGEDVDLGLRLTASGAALVGVADASVGHPAHAGLRTQLRKSFACGRMDVELQVRHPKRTMAAPGHGLLAFTIAVATSALGALLGDGRGAWLPWLWLGAYVAARFLLREARNGRPHGLPDLGADMVVALWDCCYSLGVTWQAVRTGRFRKAVRRFCYRDSARARAVHLAGSDAWAAALALLVTLLAGLA